MPLYNFSCKTCGIENVKQFLYKYNDATGHIDKRVCEACEGPVERKWGAPPKQWYQSIRNTPE